MQAQAALGEIYELGQGVRLITKKPPDGIGRAIEQGETRCATRLGAMLFAVRESSGICRNGQIVDLAAEQGNAYAQFDLAGLYMTGTAFSVTWSKRIPCLLSPEKRWM